MYIAEINPLDGNIEWVKWKTEQEYQIGLVSLSMTLAHPVANFVFSVAWQIPIQNNGCEWALEHYTRIKTTE